MTGLIITIILTLCLSIVGVILLTKYVKTEKAKNLCLLLMAIGTIVVHYSSILYHGIGHAINPDKIGTALHFIECNPNLVLPIYPCNVVMWLCLILGLTRRKDTVWYRFLVDFVFLFGVVSAVVGLAANGDYFNPNVAKDYDICKSAVAHGFMLTNVLLLATFKIFKIDTLKNTINIVFGVLLMGLVGLYCDAIILIVNSKDLMLSWNAMFLFKSPIEGVPFLTFYILGPVFIVAGFGILTLIERIIYKKEDRWYNKLKNKQN